MCQRSVGGVKGRGEGEGGGLCGDGGLRDFYGVEDGCGGRKGERRRGMGRKWQDGGGERGEGGGA